MTQPMKQTIYTIIDNSGVEFTFIPSRINRLERSGSVLRVALNNEIIRLTFDTEEKCKTIQNELITKLQEVPVNLINLGSCNEDLKMKKN